MQNLANYRRAGEDDTVVDQTDHIIVKELTRFGVEAVRGDVNDGEVKTTITGVLGNLKLTRAWSYWVVKGKVPIDLAIKLHENNIGKTDIRSDGHCGCPHPLDYGVQWVNLKTGKIATRNDERESWEKMRPHNPEMIAELEAKYEYCGDVSQNPDYSGFVSSYHIDTELGLYVFTNMCKEYKDWYKIEKINEALAKIGNKYD